MREIAKFPKIKLKGKSAKIILVIKIESIFKLFLIEIITAN
tara:strand:- start:344 stop:466 length:123 start_codon:yes stop_codon:yes gene_type:complete